MSENHGVNQGLRPQPHGGALRNGGTNKGGTGRPPNEVRALASKIGYKVLEHYDERIEDLDDATRTKVGDMALKYGIGSKVELLLSNEKLMEFVGIAAAKYLNPEQIDEFLSDIEALANGSVCTSSGESESEL